MCCIPHVFFFVSMDCKQCLFPWYFTRAKMCYVFDRIDWTWQSHIGEGWNQASILRCTFYTAFLDRFLGRLVIRNSFLYPRLKSLWSHHLFDSHTVGLWEFPAGFPVINVSLLWNLRNLMCLRPGCTPELHSLHCKYIPTGVLEGKDNIWSWDISHLLFRFQSLKVTVVSVLRLCNSVSHIEQLTCLALCKGIRAWLRLSNYANGKSSLCPMTTISACVENNSFDKLHIKRAQSSQSLGIPVCPLLAVNEASKQW